ncbi:YceI family protein [Alicyclobacillus cycloheptanicus]|uniref:Polyisoprenoid-binding protein YceI n=1 Tax=Alicyclobacillus cycloheptanicus TaxID=1457 RepID=A0ABT9XFY1_9BACL|nr:YceI family protein [Alicyclobacillus cycloheptanicus]MDQ0189203.1 polyisoprenoid-binding protein YceI [Alicyclobacillus cycloheptanicus]WDM00388.1 YceI family protein [Alicyclobacillus cycloheptanicus]
MAKSTWIVDPTHSSIEFSTKHMMVTTVKGQFTEFSADIQADPTDLTDAQISFTINTASVDTRNADRDAHLRGADFFDVEHYPNMTFKATKIVAKGNNRYDVTGDLTIRDVTKPVTFDMTFEGQYKDPWGNMKAGFTGGTTINRKDWGLNWNVALEAGGFLVSEQVKISLDIQAAQQA